jgi:Domain of Unknown Function (DUF928)
MKPLTMVAWMAASAVAMLPASGLAQEKPREQPATAPAPAQVSAGTAVYKPPLRGAPRGRIGGGTRGVGTEIIVLSVLAPDHAGLTASDQPSLYWQISTSTAYPVELTIMDPRRIEPVLETRLAGPIEAGLHRVRLADHGVRLDPEVAYRWYVTVVIDPDRRAKDVLAGGVIERVTPSPELRQRLAAAPKEQVAAVYASDGLWYDALTAASDLVDATPADPALRRERAALLSQVGLRDIRE